MYRLVLVLLVCSFAAASPAKRDIPNPCVPVSTTSSANYFIYPGDNTKFIECDLAGHMNVLTCPDGLVWSEQRLACVYRFDAGLGGTGTGTGTGGTGTVGTGTATENPCTNENLGAHKLFFPHPTDTHKFIQCDLWGDMFVLSCPVYLLWNQHYETCTPLNYVYVPPHGN